MPHHRRLIFVAVGLIILGACSPNLPTGAIEKKYYATGPWAVTTRSDNGYDFYYPTDIGANGFLHPIITWGNGTGGTASNVAYFLNHLAKHFLQQTQSRPDRGYWTFTGCWWGH